jgi:hypothetical protein
VFPIDSRKRETPAFESRYWTVGAAALEFGTESGKEE